MAKRKMDETSAPLNDASRSELGGTSGNEQPYPSTEPETTSSTVKARSINYPRKRVSVACDICRSRKTRCDAARPACSFCTDLGVECVYSKPSVWDRPPEGITTVTALEPRLAALENAISDVSALCNDVLTRLTRLEHRESVILPPIQYASPVQSLHTPSTVSQHGRSRSTLPGTDQGSHRMPTLLGFRCPPPYDGLSYDHHADFYQHAFSVPKGATYHTSQALDVTDLPPQLQWQLERAFAESVLKLVPLFSIAELHAIFTLVSEPGVAHQPMDACLLRLVIAVAKLALAGNELYSPDTNQLPGLEDFDEAAVAVARALWLPPTIRTVQCEILACSYLLLAMRPVQALSAITQASQHLVVLITAQSVGNSSAVDEQTRRAYWTTYAIETELSACLETLPGTMRSLSEKVPLPTSAIEDEGLYFLLAFSSLRKLTTEILETVGWSSGSAVYAPVVAIELRKQLFDWYRHLPPPLRFELNDAVIFDPVKAFLRAQYFSLTSVISWPFVLRCVMSGGAENSSYTEADVSVGAAECLEACNNHLKVGSTLLLQRTLISHTSIRSFYSMTVTLLLSFRIPTLESMRPADAEFTLSRAYESLQLWRDVPFLQYPMRTFLRLWQSTN